MTLTLLDRQVRTAVTRWIAATGLPPRRQDLAPRLGCDEAALVASLRRLHDAHGLLLHPDGESVWAAHPFALSPGGCFVKTAGRGYWANCLYCALGIAAARRCDAVITTRLGGEEETVVVQVQHQRLSAGADLLFHLSVPVRRWWDNVIHACASFQPFRSQAEITDWCERHGFAEGATMPLPALWAFACDWYGGYIEPGWSPRTPEETEAIFRRHGLTGPFWSLGGEVRGIS